LLENVVVRVLLDYVFSFDTWTMVNRSGLQTGQFITWTVLVWSCAAVIRKECGVGLLLEKCCLDGCFLKGVDIIQQ